MSLSAPQPKLYTILCMLVGEKTSFSIEIASDETVGDLKKAIKAKNMITFAKFAAHKMNLYRIDAFGSISKDMTIDPQKKLDPLYELTEIYPDGPPEETTHILVQPPKSALKPVIYKIFCVIEGENSPFPINIARDETVDDLKKSIKEEKTSTFAKFDADRMNLYRIDALGPILEDMAIDPQKKLNPLYKLTEIYPDGPPEETIHILVRSRKSAPKPVIYKIFCAIEGENSPFPINIARDETVADLKKPIKEKKTSTFAKFDADRMNLYRIDASESILKEITVDTRKKLWVMKELVEIYPDGPPEGIVHILVQPPQPARLSRKSHASEEEDTVAQKRRRVFEGGSSYSSRPPFCLRKQEESGELDSDKPSFYQLSSIKPLPFSLLGEYVGLFAEPSETQNKAIIARLRLFEDFRPTLRRDSDEKEVFPYRNYYMRDGVKVNFEYIFRPFGDKLVFVALADHGAELIIKFTKIYSEDAHRYCSDNGFAPLLHAVEELPDGWKMVVMVCLDNSYGTVESPLPEGLPEALRRAVDTLHKAGFVHGDIRGVNMQLSKRQGEFKVMILDFDWAGVAGEVYYPDNINIVSLKRPDGVGPGVLISQEHDLAMLDFM